MNRKQHSKSTNGQASGADQRRTPFNPLAEAAARIADYARQQGRSRARELVAALMSQGARAARHAEPPVSIHIYLPKDAKGRRPLSLKLR